MPPNDDVTDLLKRATEGEPGAVDQLLPLVYDELRRLAAHHLGGERPDHTLQPTALVHEAYLKLVNQQRVAWEGRSHFMAIASVAIRRILVDHARARKAAKRGGGGVRLSLDSQLCYDDTQATDLVALDEALHQLQRTHPDKARVVELRFFGGLTTEETARVLAVTTRTVERHWQFARAWLFRAMTTDTSPTPE